LKETTRDPGQPRPEATGKGRLLALYGIGRRLLEQREPGQVIETIQQAIVEHLRPDRACILTVEGNDAYRPLVAHGFDPAVPVASWPLSRTVLLRARQDGVAVLAYDSQSDLRFEAAESVRKLRIRSVMCVPLGKVPVRGLVYLDNRSNRAFTEDDLDFLTAASLYAGLVLERAEEHARTSAALQLSDERLALLQDELLRHRIVGRSPALLAAYDTVRRLARSGARVLLRGETGTGKELFARAYAAHCPRAGKPYVPVPIPALAPTLIESELFGHVRGAFTEAARDKKGRFELADKGILFLDEVGDVEPAVQKKLLRFLDSGELFRVGDTEARFVDALVVSATNRPLEKDVESGRFRADLLARLGHAVFIPPLRERPEDVPLLVEHFASLYARGGPGKVFSDGALEVLRGYPWPLNVRELQQVVERVACLLDHEVVGVEDLPAHVRWPAGGTVREGAFPPLREVVEKAEREHLLRALAAAKGSKRRAIELLQISSETFYRRLDEFGLRKRDE
jgi:two-component system, NtrC family, response regulator AtoC